MIAPRPVVVLLAAAILAGGCQGLGWPDFSRNGTPEREQVEELAPDADVGADAGNEADVDQPVTDTDTEQPATPWDPATFRVCTVDGWCWQSPRPYGHTLLDVFVLDREHVWAVSSQSVLFWDGQGDWIVHTLDDVIGYGLFSVWAASPTDVWVVGDAGMIFRWDGKTWRREWAGVETGFEAVFGLDSEHVWIAGEMYILFWNGSFWQTQRNDVDVSITWTALWAADAEHAWAGTEGGDTAFFDGQRWNVLMNPGMPPIRAIWGADAEHVWFAGESGLMGFWDGHDWPSSPEFPGRNTVFDLWGLDEKTVWAVGEQGAIWSFDGTGWTQQHTGNLVLYGVSGADREHVLAVGGGASAEMLAFDGRHWSAAADPVAEFGALAAVSGADKDHVWVVGGYSSSLLWDGQSWSSHFSGATGQLAGVHVQSRSAAWAAGANGALVQWDGAAWSLVDSGTEYEFLDVWGAAGHTWASSQNGFLLHHDGASWELEDNPTWRWIYGGWSLDALTVWATCHDDTVLVKMGDTGWTTTKVGGDGIRLRDLWLASPEQVWAVGLDGAIRHFDGLSWSGEAAVPGPVGDLHAVWGADADKLFAVGAWGRLLQRDPAGFWYQNDSSTSRTLRGVWGADADHVWVVGDSGTILFRGSD